MQEYTASSGYRVTFVGQGALNDNNSVDATQALPLPVFGASAITPQLIANSSLIAVLPNSQNGMVQQWNLQVQQQLDRFTSVTVAYVGNKSEHLMTWFNANAPVLGTGAADLCEPSDDYRGRCRGNGKLQRSAGVGEPQRWQQPAGDARVYVVAHAGQLERCVQARGQR